MILIVQRLAWERRRNVRVSDVMPMQGQKAGDYYVLEFEEKERNTEEYHKKRM